MEQSFSRVQSTWLPATPEESYEIVRRRLFNDIAGENALHRGNAVKQFWKMYREDTDSFPMDCDKDDYRKKLEVFILYTQSYLTSFMRHGVRLINSNVQGGFCD